VQSKLSQFKGSLQRPTHSPLVWRLAQGERGNEGVCRYVRVCFPVKQRFVKYDPKLKATARLLRKHSTLAEILLWNQLKGKRILGYDFHRQKPIHDYIVDFFCPQLMLAVEIDGASHVDKDEEDKERQEDLESLGIRFLRFQDDLVKKDLGIVVDIIKQWILEHREDNT
jgi:very-short-patch-repair endonuclease